MFREKRIIMNRLNAEKTEAEAIFDKVKSGELNAEEGVDKFQQIDETRELIQNQMNASLPDFEKIIDSSTGSRLQRQLESKNPEEKKQVRIELNTRRNNVRAYLAQLNSGSNIHLIDGTKVNVFSEDKSRGIDTKRQYLEEFISLPIQEQAKWLQEIKNDIEERTQQFNKLLEFVQGRADKEKALKNFQKLRRSERTTYLSEMVKIDTEFKEVIANSGSSEKGIKNRLRHFESLGLEGKKLELAKLREALSVPDKDKEFRALSQERQKLWPDFAIMPKNEKEKVLKQARQEITAEYKKLIKDCPYELTRADQKLFETTVQGRFDISMAEMCIKSFESSVVTLAKFVAEKSEEYPKEVLNHFNWNGISTFERKQLLEDPRKIKEYAENQEHISLDNTYINRVTKYSKEKPFALLTEESAKKYIKWFQELPLDKKRAIANSAKKSTKLDDLENTVDARKKLIKRFSKLPSAIRKEYKDEFAESGFEERMDLVLKIETENNELDQEFNEKLDQQIDERLLSEKSRDRYWKWFTKKLNIEQKNDYLNNCNLDKPERRIILEVFEETLIPAASEKVLPGEISKMEKEFYNADLNKRRDLLKRWIKKYLPKGTNILKNKLNNLQDEKALEKAKDINTTYGPMLKIAEKHEDNDDIERALGIYEDILEGYNLSEEDEKFIKQKIKELKRECDEYESIEDGHFHTVIENEIHGILKNDSVLKGEQERLTVLEEIHGIQFRNEILFNRANTTSEQLDRTLDDEYTSEFNEEFQNYDPNSSIYYDENDELQTATDETSFDVNEFDNQEDIKHWKNYVSHKQEDSTRKRFDPKLAIVNPKTKKRYTSKQFDAELLFPARQSFIEKMYKKILESLELEEEKLSPRAKNAIINQLYNRDWRVKLPKITNPSIQV